MRIDPDEILKAIIKKLKLKNTDTNYETIDLVEGMIIIF